ncbi:MAG TPA: hypothetical protein VFI06_06885 [Chitinophagaceae bacterium]|nr:hypothetical protein [Chitinophagaceae bacterium]
MRNIFILLFLSIIIESCKPYSYFKSPNDLLNKECQIFLTDGTKIDGKLTVQFETEHYVGKYLKVLTDEKTERNILITDIKSYKYNNEVYVPKEINLEAYEIPYRDKVYMPNVNNILFLKRLTNDSAKLQLFELFKSRTNSSEWGDQYDYYISFNNENRFASWSIRGSRFFPNFEEKMSKIVSDCPSLVEKIRQQINGYTARQISVDAKKNEVIKKIVEEYNNCQ